MANITSLLITREANNIWTYQDNTMPVGKPMSASYYDGIVKGDLIYFNTDNGGILYNGIPYSIIEYVDSADSGNDFTPTSAVALIVYLKGQGFFDNGSGGGSGSGTFIGLTDVYAANYFGRKGQIPMVNDGETGIELVDNEFDQDNIDIRKNFIIDDDDTIDDMVFKINGFPNYTINEKQSVWFVGRIGNLLNPANSRIIKFKMLNKGKGNYGVGGTQLFKNDLEIIYDNTATILDIENDPSTDTIIYGDITAQTVSQWLNLENPAIPIQSQEDGYTIFKGSVDGIDTTYLWIGDAGVYGVGETMSTMADFEVLSNEVPDLEITETSPFQFRCKGWQGALFNTGEPGEKGDVYGGAIYEGGVMVNYPFTRYKGTGDPMDIANHEWNTSEILTLSDE